MTDNLVFSNVLHHPLRTLTSVVGISVGAFLIIATIGLANGTLRTNAQREANVGAEIMVRVSGSFGISGTVPFQLPMAQVADISKIEGVQKAIPIGQNLDSAEDTETGTRLIDGVNFDEYAEIAGLKIAEGRKMNINGNEALIDTGWQIQKKIKIGSTLRIYEKDFTVVGSYSPPSGARIKIPLQTMQQQLLGETNNCTAILVKVMDPGQQENIAERILQKFPEDQIILTRDFEELYVHSIPVLDIFLNVVIGIAGVISTLVILLTMFTTVNERTRQIGILKALGMSKTEIAWIITEEALIICFFGFLLGVGLTILFGFLLAQTTSGLEMKIEWKWLLLTLLGGLVSGAIGALYPAVRAARLDAVEALSYE